MKRPRIAFSVILLTIVAGVPDAQAEFLDQHWARSVGGSGRDIPAEIVTDSYGSIYVAGAFTMTADFDPGEGAFPIDSAGGRDAFVCKLDASGELIWARTMGGGGDDTVHAIAVDHNGAIITTGSFSGVADFDPGPGSANLVSPYGNAAFVSKLDADGHFVWARGMSGLGQAGGVSVALTDSGDIFVGGNFAGDIDFDPGAAVSELESAGAFDIFVCRLNGLGELVWARRFGGADGDSGEYMAYDAVTETLYITGYFFDVADFDPGPASHELVATQGADAFVSKLDSAGNLIWALGMGGERTDRGTCVRVDELGDVYVVGDFEETVDFDPGPGVWEFTAEGEEDIFVLKLSGLGEFFWAQKMGGAGEDYGSSLAVAEDGTIYTTGHFLGMADFDPGPGEFFLDSGVNEDVFISKLTGNGAFVWAMRMGGPGPDRGLSIVVDPSDTVLTTGHYKFTAQFGPDSMAESLTAVQDEDVFITKIGVNPTPPLNLSIWSLAWFLAITAVWRRRVPNQ